MASAADSRAAPEEQGNDVTGAVVDMPGAQGLKPYSVHADSLTAGAFAFHVRRGH